MTRKWIRERDARWDDDKARIIGAVPTAVFETRYADSAPGDPMPGDWWRVEEDGATVGYGWLDIVWGDAEVLLATDPAARRRGIGTFILQHLDAEAQDRGLNYVYNTVRPTHPDREALTAWLTERGFRPAGDGSLRQPVGAGKSE